MLERMSDLSFAVCGWGTDPGLEGNLMLERMSVRPRLCPTIVPTSLPHFRLYEVVLLHMCLLPYKYRKILEMLFKLMKLWEIMCTAGSAHLHGHAAYVYQHGLISPRPAAGRRTQEEGQESILDPCWGKQRSWDVGLPWMSPWNHPTGRWARVNWCVGRMLVYTHHAAPMLPFIGGNRHARGNI